jgi:hypothetical protein
MSGHDGFETFVKNNRFIYSEITEAAESGDIAAASGMVYMLINDAAQLGEVALHEAASVLEYKLNSSRTLPNASYMRKFKAELDAVLKWPQLFAELVPLLERGDTKCLQYVGALRSVAGADRIADEIEDLNFEQALLFLELIHFGNI